LTPSLPLSFGRLEVGATVKIAGIPGVVEEVSANGIHRVRCESSRSGVAVEEVRLVERWRLTL